MSDPTVSDPPRSSAPRPLEVRILGCACLGLILLVITPFVLRSWDVIAVLASGWWSFLRRTGPQISWNWDLVLMALLCVALILTGGQWFLNWLWQAARPARPSVATERWRWKWTW